MVKKFGSENPGGVKEEIFKSMELNSEQQKTADSKATIREIIKPYLPKNPRETSKLTGEIMEEYTIPTTDQKIIQTSAGLFLEMSMGKTKFYQKLSGTTLEELKSRIEEATDQKN